MNILIHSNNIYFNIGIAQCFRDIQKTAPELKVIHSLPLSHLPELSGLDVIILSLENYHDYLAAAEIAQHFQGLVIGFTSAGNVRRGRAFFADTLLWVSQREAVREVSRLLRCLAERRWPLVPRFLEFFKASGFRGGFEDKGRFKAYVQDIPVYLIVHDNPGLLGSGAHLRQTLGQVL